MKDVKAIVNFPALSAEEDIKKEKSRARELRRSRWWRKKCATGVCYYCGTRVEPPELTMDHVVLLVRGGKNVIGSDSHAQQAAEIIRRFEPVLLAERPDVLVVVRAEDAP